MFGSVTFCFGRSSLTSNCVCVFFCVFRCSSARVSVVTGYSLLFTQAIGIFGRLFSAYSAQTKRFVRTQKNGIESIKSEKSTPNRQYKSSSNAHTHAYPLSAYFNRDFALFLTCMHIYSYWTSDRFGDYHINEKKKKRLENV